MPEAVLEYDDEGRVSGAHFAEHDLSHQIIEEFMLAANEAVAEHFTQHEVPFLRRVHPAPNEEKLEAFAEFAGLLGYQIKRPQDRFELQRVLNETADKPERAAVHYALLAQPEAGDVLADPGRALRPGQRELLPLHLADPPLPGPAGAPAARPLDQARARRRRTWTNWPRWATTAPRWSAGPRRPSASW